MDYEIEVQNIKKPGKGCLLITVPPRAETTKSGLYLSTGFIAGSTYSYKEECQRVALLAIRSKEGQELKAKNKIKELRKLVDREVARVRVPKQDEQFGADRYNNIFGDVVIPPVGSELQPGDRVYFSYLTLPNAAKWHDQGCLYDFKGQRWASIRASSLLFAKRGHETIMLNNNVLCEPIKLPVENHLLHYQQNDTIFDRTRGVIAFAPKDSPLIKGDIVLWDKGCDIPLEYELIQSLSQTYYIMKEDEILATSGNIFEIE